MTAVQRNERGHILPGQRSLNPSGKPPTPPEIRDEVQRILSAGTPDAARKLVELTQDSDPKVAMAASALVLDRVFGRPTVSVDANVKTSSIQQAHLSVLLDLANRRKAVADRGDDAVVINAMPVTDVPAAE